MVPIREISQHPRSDFLLVLLFANPSVQLEQYMVLDRIVRFVCQFHGSKQSRELAVLRRYHHNVLPIYEGNLFQTNLQWRE